MIPWLQYSTEPFPPIDHALDDPNGLLAAGGDLTSTRLISAYRSGIFPWYSPGEPILWWSPNPRCVVKPDQIHISRSMRKRLKKKDYAVCFDRNFPAVIEACSSPRDDDGGTWITEEMKQSYCDLHNKGIAHSVEVYIDGELVGGLYGLAMGKLFFGESMFSRARDASKIAFIKMVEQLRIWGYALIDCQVSNDHLFSLGAEEISRSEFQNYLTLYLDEETEHSWQFDE
ncbi:leucyl/phenylalanyl-tRNA--protein transferase [Neptuniibacter sp.]|uniref:leucyl/phenylalanyl-tRNA--protein transferase n=1 Tax=Neptuniibacter sp. TaxID=1962643 RepID=UPI002619BFDA|nr:leucyl/phenylalanyl-tRNA--protein transferase [Neptuniibacter sp.]MCP4595318.1 leucyl/phenylalanyl-tRNA--protein transferase [Neptuniibacter sp.]